MSDHIHMVVSPSNNHKCFKSPPTSERDSSHEIFKQIPTFQKRYPKGAFWSTGKFYRTVAIQTQKSTAFWWLPDHRKFRHLYPKKDVTTVSHSFYS
jgi:hypothetical protein